jgi:hypothetical protein
LFCPKHLFVNFFARQFVNVRLWGWARSIRRGGLLHELRYYAVETFLRVDEVAHVTTGTNHTKRAEELQERVRRVYMAMVIVIVVVVAVEVCFCAPSTMLLGTQTAGRST